FLLDEDRKKEISSDAAEIEGVQGLLVRDVRNEVSVTLSSVRVFRCWNLPLETSLPKADSSLPKADSSLPKADSSLPKADSSLPKADSDRVQFQSHCFVLLWDFTLAPGGTWENHLSVGFEKTPSA